MRIVRETLFFFALVHLIAISAFAQVFPVFPSGTLSDGSLYRSTLTVANASSADTSCSARFQRDTKPSVVFNFTVNKASWTLWHPNIDNTDVYIPSYLVLTCDQPTSVEARYAYYSSAPVMVGEANVLASSGVTYAAFVLDQSDSQTRTGIAITNDSDTSISATVTVYDSNNNNATITRSITLDPRSTLTKFVDEITGWQGSLGFLTVTAPSTIFVSGLRYTGPVFSTLVPILSQ